MKIEQNYKLRVTPEESKKVQEVCFLYGVDWFIRGDKVKNEDKPFLYVEAGGITYNREEGYFLSHGNTEISPQDFLKKYEPPQWMKDIEDEELRKRVIENWDGNTNLVGIYAAFDWLKAKEGSSFWGEVWKKSHLCKNCTYEEFKHLDESRQGNKNKGLKKLTLDDGTECYLKDDYYLAIKTVAKELSTEIHNKKHHD